MQNQHKPVLIFAQSGRFLAQSATQAAYPVWVADCFGDSDTLLVSERWLQLPALSELSQQSFLAVLDQISAGENCMLICGSGIELLSDFLVDLPNNIEYLGNSTDSIKKVKTPSYFFALLQQHAIPHPPTRFSQPEQNEGWLIKSASGMGGIHIQLLDQTNTISDDCYFQQYTSGVSCSALFLATNQGVTLLSINKQITDTSSKTPFRLDRIEAPANLPETCVNTLTSIIKTLSSELDLIGLNSIDFLITPENQLLILEINPRPSASMELVTLDKSIIQYHIDACRNQCFISQISSISSFKSLSYLYAEHEYLIPNDMVWPLACSDLPSAGNIIHHGEPICSYLVESPESENEALRLIITTKIIEQLIPIT